MTRVVRLIALQPLEFHGDLLTVGEVFTAPAHEAAMLLHKRRAKFAPAPHVTPSYRRQHLTAVTPDEKPKTRRQYRRRDLVTESSD